MNRQRRRALRPVLDGLDDRCLLSVLTPAQVTHAYGLDAISFSAGGTTVKGNGSGQTIAIVDAEHDPYLALDLHTFDQAYGLPDPSLVQIDQAGSRTNNGWALEEALDVEWAHAIAPGASIVVVEARSTSHQDMLAAVNTARSLPGVSVVSMSWGMGEFSNELSADRYFTTLVGHNGVTFVASSGDQGAAGGAEWPAVSPNVLAVGGTTLLVDSAGDRLNELAWSGSSGGLSRFEVEPSYQHSVQTSGRRSSPDVAFVADPGTGVAVYTTAPSTGVGSWLTVGGTSVGAPAWAAIIAIVDQGRATVGEGSLDGGSQTLPALYSISSGDFHTVTAGSLVSTGLGTPRGVALVDDLAFGATTPSTGAVSTGISSEALGHASQSHARHRTAGLEKVVRELAMEQLRSS